MTTDPPLSRYSDRIQNIMLPSIILEYLERNAAKDTNAPELVYNHYLAELQRIRDDIVPIHVERDPTQWNSAYDAVSNKFFQLEDQVLVAAERLWRDHFKVDNGQPDPRAASRKRLTGKDAVAINERRWLDYQVSQVCKMLLIWFEARCFHIRADSNFTFARYTEFEDPADKTIQEIKTAIQEYYRQIAEWDRELRSATGLRAFHQHHSEAQHFRALSKMFGPEMTGSEESGWLSQAAIVGPELRYEYFEALRREKRRQGHHFASFALNLFRIVIGYGQKPRNLFGSVVGVVLVSSAIYFGLDIHSPTACTTAASFTWQSLLEYFYSGLASLTTLGSAHTACDAGGRWLILFEGILGYFLLAFLAALFIEKLTEAER